MNKKKRIRKEQIGKYPKHEGLEEELYKSNQHLELHNTIKNHSKPHISGRCGFVKNVAAVLLSFYLIGYTSDPAPKKDVIREPKPLEDILIKKTPETISTKKENEAVKYAILYAGYDWRTKDRNVVHPIDKNATWLSMVRSYNHLLRYGVWPENIHLLYCDGKPDFSDPAIKNIKGEIERRFFHSADKTRLKTIEKEIGQEMDANDVLIIYIQAHGDSTAGPLYCGPLCSEDYEKYLTSKEFSNMLNDNKSDNNLVVVGSCHTNNFIESITANGTFIGLSRYVAGWVDRELCFEELFFRNLNESENDANKDGHVDYDEAFNKAQEVYRNRGLSKKDFMLTGYLREMKDFSERLNLYRTNDEIDFECLIKHQSKYDHGKAIE
ncbi:hypothetical protein KY345_00430 [Candidatus Woesearchaeota archaeon]|nr:hypothetical protein [Candidatus Woesearchaeota archaeon]